MRVADSYTYPVYYVSPRSIVLGVGAGYHAYFWPSTETVIFEIAKGFIFAQYIKPHGSIETDFSNPVYFVAVVGED